MPDLLKLADPAHPSSALIEACLERLRRGELLAGPTDTTYGLFCDPFRPKGLDRIAALKGRHKDRPIPLLVADRLQAARLAETIPPLAERLMETFWPGGLTIVVPASSAIPKPVTGGTGTVGLRQPDSPYLLRLMEALGGPLTGTSANRTGMTPSASAAEVLSSLGNDVDAIVDGGVADKREGSTVVEVSAEGFFVLREGVVALDNLDSVARGWKGS
ncbi:MAG: threonylcarbamoyl-AMP synthase [Nitrospinae bacterium]|nr:threonylcarbamoyl-AMP synthase [Nitrospinota bacterium]